MLGHNCLRIVHIIISLMMCTNTIVEVREMLIYSPRSLHAELYDGGSMADNLPWVAIGYDSL